MRDIAVIIPSFNDESILKGCLEALNRQTYRERTEIIVSLDGGSPLTPEIASCADTVIHSEHNGPASARNRGWCSIEARYILFTDSDCRPSPDWVERLVKHLEEGADGVKGAYSSGGRKIIQRLAQIEFEERYKLLRKSDNIDLVDTYSAGFRREALELVGGFDESFPFPDHEDVDLSYRMDGKGLKLVFEPEALVAHTHRNSWLRYFRMKVSRGRWRMKVVRYFPEKMRTDSYTPLGLKLQIILAALLLPSAVLSFFFPFTIIALGIAFLASSLPLCTVSLKTDPTMAIFVPGFALWRGIALLSGMIWGIFGVRKAEK